MSRSSRLMLLALALVAFIGLAPAAGLARGGGGGGGGGGHFGGGHFGGGGFRGGFPGGFRGRGFGFGVGVGPAFWGYPYYWGYPYAYGYDCPLVRRLVPTPYGLRWRLVPVCY
jgi:hypothetical protein